MQQGPDSKPQSASAVRAAPGPARPRSLRARAGLLLLVAAASLSACGGGGAFVTLDIGILVGGVVVSGPPVYSGGHRAITMYAGQSIELDANEPVYWTLLVGGSSVVGNITVVYGGLAITQTAIGDSGIEVWNLLEEHGIEHVMLVGVHTNMCVLGRPFGLRQLAKNGKNVVLVRDLTDTMYNPKMPPMVSHFEGTRLIVEHIEKYVCPTITSDQLLGGKEFRFKGDK